MQKQNEQLLKNLMNDPEYRGKLIEIIKGSRTRKRCDKYIKKQ